MLQEASYNGDYSCVKTIIDKGANVNEASPMSPLMWAAQAGHESVVRLLLDHGASVDFGADNGNTALGYASSGQSPPTVTHSKSPGRTRCRCELPTEFYAPHECSDRRRYADNRLLTSERRRPV